MWNPRWTAQLLSSPLFLKVFAVKESCGNRQVSIPCLSTKVVRFQVKNLEIIFPMKRARKSFI